MHGMALYLEDYIMKKYIAGVVALVLMFTFAFTGVSFAEGDKLSIVTTIFPVYDWVREIVGDSENVEITLLLDSGVDLHSYQPTAQDVMKIATCDVFIYVGGESDEWVEDALNTAVNRDMKVVNLMEALGGDVREEELVEGMEEAGHEHEHEDEHEHEEEIEYDEHVWLSLRNAQKLVKAIAQALGEADPEGADAWAANAEAYAEKLAALDEEYAAAVEAGAFRTLLFGDRFPFRYLADDYGLDYYAAFSGCSAESEASFETIVFLAGKVDELGLPAVLTIEGSDGRIAQTIVQSTASKDAEILKLNSMQATTAADAADGATYMGIMADNLDVLKSALGSR